MNDERISRYLSDRAERINPPPVELATVIERSTQRRHRRRATVGIAAAVVVVAAAAGLVANRGDHPTKVSVAAAPAVVPSNLDWSIIYGGDGLGLGWSNTLAATTDGSTYSLSTAPGIGDPDQCCGQEPATLYRSTDGQSWTPVGLPTDMWATGLAANGGRLYAVGTAPDGGSMKLVLASTDDGGANWSSVDLPGDLTDLRARYPKELQVGGPSVASGPNGTVAVLTVGAFPDVSEELVALGYDGYSWNQQGDGINVIAAPKCAPDASGLPDGSDVIECRAESERPETIAHLTWDQLGVSPELQSLINGQVHVFASADGVPFHEVTVPVTTGAGAQVVVDANGYQLVVNPRFEPTAASLLTSPDGETWTASPLDTGGWVGDVGVVSGRLAYATWGDAGATVSVGNGSGGWNTINLAEVLGEPADRANIYDIDFGPLGFAAMVGVGEIGPEPQELRLVHSADGVTVSVVDVSQMLNGVDVLGSPSGVTVTPDAITLRFARPTDEDPGHPPTKVPGQILVVGTPH